MLAMIRIVKGLALAAVAALALAGGEARAGFTVTLDTVTGAGPFTYSYSATIAPDDEVRTGDFFRIYDFAGYVAGSAVAPAGWTAAVANLNPTPPPNVILSHGDDAATPNLTFTYTGAASLTPAQVAALAFTAQSTLGAASIAFKDFAGRDTKALGDAVGTKVDSVGDVRVPSVPEPSSLISVSLGVLAVGGAYGYRRRRQISDRA